LSAAALPAWRLVAECAVGVLHRESGLPCQDRAVVDLCLDGEHRCTALVAAVADGAGSALEGEQGAQLATTAALGTLKRAGAGCETAAQALELVREAFVAARHELIESAQQQRIDTREFSTTLLVALVTPAFACFGQIGDGAIVFGDADDLALAFACEQEMVNVTDFVTDESALGRLRMHCVERRVERLAMMSDGLMPLFVARRDQSPHRPAFVQLFSTLLESSDDAALPEQLRGFLQSEAVNARTDDDKSLVLAVRAPSA
jgi:hypothetical protein